MLSIASSGYAGVMGVKSCFQSPESKKLIDVDKILALSSSMQSSHKEVNI